MKSLKELIREECEYQLSEQMLDEMLSQMTERELKSKEVLIACGGIDTNIYIVKEGIFRVSYMNGLKEVTTGFALPGTMMVSWFSYYGGKPSYLQIDACCSSKVLQLSKQVFDRYISESHEFAQWVASMAHCQLYFYEMKQMVINGDAKERYLSLLANRPDIIRNVSLSVVASYLGVTPQYLSYIRRQLNK